MALLSYRRHRFPPEIIQHAIWLYLWTVPREARARFSDQTIHRLQLSIRPLMQRALLASRIGAQLPWRTIAAR
jgi:hypothetical protein